MTKTKTTSIKKRKATFRQAEHSSLLSEFDISLFREGKHYMLYKHLGAHAMNFDGVEGVQFAVWAPGANYVSVIGDFNDWKKDQSKMAPRRDSSGIWELFVPDINIGSIYKYHIGNDSGYQADKADPFGFEMEMPPHTGSRITLSATFKWADKKWLNNRLRKHITEQPLSIYEVHLGSWRRVPEEGNRWMNYREMADHLPQYCAMMGFTHVELLPVMEHPFFGSWGYQLTGYFAPSSRFGTADDFKYLVNELHKHNIGVILDWVPSHFPGDTHGLYKFDGTHLFEHADPREGYHPDWKSYIFNYGRNEVRSFLISNAIFWLEEFHIDGLRVDAVASMLYRDYSRNAGEWIPNHLGGRENLEAIAFLQQMNEAVHTLQPGTFTIAEESTAFPKVTRTVHEEGLGFDFKWMMGWMHDSLEYFKRDPLYRAFHQHDLTFSMQYTYAEKFVLPLSHDEVVHGKYSLIRKMPGDEWQQAANLRLLYAYMFGHPGAKLLFMGAEFGQEHEWQHDYSLDWHLLERPLHKGLQDLIRHLNHLYQNETALYQNNYSPEGFEWIDFNDTQNSVFCWLRKGQAEGDYLIFIANATPNILYDYQIGISYPHTFREILNTDKTEYGGGNHTNSDEVFSFEKSLHGKNHAVSITLPPLGLVILKPLITEKPKKIKTRV